jgi:hypothetical protein
MAVDRSDREVEDGFETTFLSDHLAKMPDWVSPKQAAVIRKLGEKYLGAERTRAYLGQHALMSEDPSA